MARPKKTAPVAAMVGAGLGSIGGPLGAGVGGLIGAALGTFSVSLEEALSDIATEMGFEFSNLHWIDRYTLDVVVSDEEQVFHVIHLKTSASGQDAETIADELYDQFKQQLAS